MINYNTINYKIFQKIMENYTTIIHFITITINNMAINNYPIQIV